MQATINVLLGIMGATIAIMLLCTAAMMCKLVWVASGVFLRGLLEVRWGVIAFHSGLGFVVSLLVSPRLGIPLAIAAALTSTFIVAVVMHKLHNLEVKTPARSRVRSS